MRKILDTTGLNNKIQAVIKKAYGFRNRARLYADLYFHCGGLNLYPALPRLIFPR